MRVLRLASRLFSDFGRLMLSLAIAFWGLTGSRSIAGSGAGPVVEPEVIAPAPLVLDLEGFYAGGDFAYAFGTDGDEIGHRAAGGSLVAMPGELGPTGLNLGLRIGWRDTIPTNGFAYVYGLELGYGSGSIGDDFSTPSHQGAIDVKETLSLRFKGGVTNFPGDTHYYGIVGFTRGDINYAVSGTAGGDTISVSDRSDYDGYLLGVGVERAIRENLSMTLEYEYAKFDTKTLTDSGGSSTVATPSYGNLRLGLNFAF